MSVSKIPRKTERRRHARKPAQGMVPILCQEEHGPEHRYPAKLLDISLSGARLWLPVRLPARAIVSFNSPELGIGGRGTVRYCNATKGGYEVGLEMANGTGWREQNSDLRNLAAALKQSNSVSPASETVPGLFAKKE